MVCLHKKLSVKLDLESGLDVLCFNRWQGDVTGTEMDEKRNGRKNEKPP